MPLLAGKGLDLPVNREPQLRRSLKGPGSSVVEHLHGKQKVVGSIPILGKKELNGGNNG